VLINGGGSYLRLNSGGIESGTNGAWIEYAASHSSIGPDNMPLDLKLPTTDLKELPGSLLLRLSSHTQHGYAFAGEPYQLFKDGVQIDSGITDEHGQIFVRNHQKGTPAYEVRLTNGARFDAHVHDRLDDSSEHQLANKGFRVSRKRASRHEGYGIDEEGSDA